jgi:hypothetical protein
MNIVVALYYEVKHGSSLCSDSFVCFDMTACDT